ncbi:MAG: hypothetical protein H6Q33_1851 [Deltaproteobacteria bacterium]|nr:hypothetical protein [Deltaproteobacteria bacterium]
MESKSTMKRARWGFMGVALAMTLAARGVWAQCCGDCNGDGAVTVDEVLTAVNHALTSCSDDGICRPERLPASGQTTAYGAGSDGDVRAGATLAYTDNGDGTITDHNTGLTWEKKDDSGGIHDKDNVYTWGMGFPPFTMNGTMVTEFLATLNTQPCFADHCDWRVPNVRELQSIVDYEIEHAGPMVQPVFHNAAGCTECTDVMLASCSCTASSPTTFYWSSTTFRFTPGYAWGVYFDSGFVHNRAPKDVPSYVRAVRGGV